MGGCFHRLFPVESALDQILPNSTLSLISQVRGLLPSYSLNERDGEIGLGFDVGGLTLPNTCNAVYECVGSPVGGKLNEGKIVLTYIITFSVTPTYKILCHLRKISQAQVQIV